MVSGNGLILTRSAPLRLLTLLLFYFTQGFPVGLFFYAVPAWMAANGASTGEVAGVVGTAALPWSIKLINGFLIDRYTFLPMGRRRSWIIGAQALIVVALLVGALLVPAHDDVFLLSAIGFCANLAVTFQDVGIDSLAVDIMAENERAKAAGIMFGAQAIGIAAATALGGAMLEQYGFAACMMVAALVPGAVMGFGMVIREREGERRLPWSAGASHPHNRAIQVAAWRPLLANGFRAVFLPLSLALLPLLLMRALPDGASETFLPGLATDTAGWALSDYTEMMASSGLLAGVLGLFFGGWLVDKVGAQRFLLILLPLYAALLAGMGLMKADWAAPGVLGGFIAALSLFQVAFAIAMIPLCMRLCSPAVAATQFTIYMATANLGRPLGASIAAATAPQGIPEWMFWIIALCFAAGTLLLALVRFPTGEAAEHKVAKVLPQGDGLAPAVD